MWTELMTTHVPATQSKVQLAAARNRVKAFWESLLLDMAASELPSDFGSALRVGTSTFLLSCEERLPAP